MDKRQQYFDEIKQSKAVVKADLEQALGDKFNAKLIIDCSYSQHMALQDKKSLAMQAQIIVGNLKKTHHLIDGVRVKDNTKPFGFHLVNVTDPDTDEQLKIRNSHKWIAKVHNQKLGDCFGDSEIDWANTVYLSPDSD